jgi:hypothetical protein
MVTRFTSFVAVDPTRKVSAGDPTTVVQPVEVPEGVDPAAAGAMPGQSALSPPSPALTEQALERQDVGGDREEILMASPGLAPAERGPRGCNCLVGAGSEGQSGPRFGWLAFTFAAAALGGRVALRRGSRRRGACVR